MKLKVWEIYMLLLFQMQHFPILKYIYKPNVQNDPGKLNQGPTSLKVTTILNRDLT